MKLTRERVIGGLALMKLPFSNDHEILDILDFAITILKKYEPVKPTILDYPSGRRRAWCGSCGYRIKIGYKGDCTENYCGKCGKPVKWNE